MISDNIYILIVILDTPYRPNSIPQAISSEMGVFSSHSKKGWANFRSRRPPAVAASAALHWSNSLSSRSCEKTNVGDI